MPTTSWPAASPRRERQPQPPPAHDWPGRGFKSGHPDSKFQVDGSIIREENGPLLIRPAFDRGIGRLNASDFALDSHPACLPVTCRGPDWVSIAGRAQAESLGYATHASFALVPCHPRALDANAGMLHGCGHGDRGHDRLGPNLTWHLPRQ